jgi:hypothetical protein
MTPTSDWRSAHAAHALSRLDRAGFAAEFLRRNPVYRRDYLRVTRGVAADMVNQTPACLALARRWGLSFPVRPTPPPDETATRPVAAGAVADRRCSRRCPG